ncbi:MAG: UDP-N-acetylmuramoyl-tripeptide--D-alanyl-D-alanine ligase [Planctomycetes bacterium]|nr:UDP-N-acetylmuramoyl-tripeptide--D-alanyl-D-alanine ligase [Planctomycetota bacterium]MCB9910179.1 UDP-N-acetylmuramoyl-tripeptide--D-alanyl-D-alanine ligase [Planctomycetota bacterium]HRV81791.1 UDP-N-acetylmuramoyl-tripeptide--D-alanyl-D-alanine ligase [Planctomycetota bacterium]
MIGLAFEDILKVTGARLVAGDASRSVLGLSTDTRQLHGGELYLSLRGPNFDGDAFAAQALGRGAAGMILRQAPKTPWPQAVPLAEHPEPRRALGDLARWIRTRHRGHVIGITGSCGKTSTKEILVQLLSTVQRVHGSPASFNNDVGVPLTILGAPEGCDAWVVEIGTNGPGEIANLARIAQPTGSIVTNIGESHLAGLGSTQGVAKEKGALVACLGPEHFCVLNADCAFTPYLAGLTRARIVTFALASRADVMATDLHFEAGSTSLQLTAPGLASPVALTVPLLGSHMVQNLLAALAALVGMGIPLQQVLPAIAHLRGAGRRMQIHRRDGLTLVDDSYNANPLSVAAGIRQLATMETTGRRVLVVGDMLELGERAVERHHEVGRQAAWAGIDELICVGQFAGNIAAGAMEHGLASSSILTLRDGAACLDAVPGRLRPGDAVLIKASRGVGLDSLVEALLEQVGAL